MQIIKSGIVMSAPTKPAADPGRVTCSVVMRADQPVPVISVTGDIGRWAGDVNSAAVHASISAALAGGATEAILMINSPGGDLFEGGAIYDLLKASGVKITAHIHGLCASAATYVACAADQILVGPSARWMVHRPTWYGSGNFDELQQMAVDLKSVEDKVIEVYMARTGKDRDAISAAMLAGSFISANDAIAFGWADGLIEAPAAEPAPEPAPAASAAPQASATPEPAEPVQAEGGVFARICAAVAGVMGINPTPAPVAQAEPAAAPAPVASAPAQDPDMLARINGLQAELATMRSALESASAVQAAAVTAAAVSAVSALGADPQSIPSPANEPDIAGQLASMSAREIVAWKKSNPELASSFNF